MKNKNKPIEFTHESIENNETLVNILNEIILGFKNKKLTLGTNGRDLSFDLRNKLILEIKLKVRPNGKCKLVFQIEWKNKADSENNFLTIEAINNDKD